MATSDKSAFPVPDLTVNGNVISCADKGMTLREYYVGQALIGAVLSGMTSPTIGDYCTEAADRAIAALKEEIRGKS